MTYVETSATHADLVRARAVLAQRQAEHERLARELEATGITEFVDRADWLMAFWSADERLVWDRRWMALGISDPAPFQRPANSWLVVSRPTTARKHRPRNTFTPRELEIAMNALDNRRTA